jgi:hypothetical protein
MTRQNEYHVYNFPIQEGCRIIERLGVIQLRADGRWNWWRRKSDFHGDWRGGAQGVAESRDQAKERVEEGWPIPFGEVLDQMIRAVTEIAKRHGQWIESTSSERIRHIIASHCRGE